MADLQARWTKLYRETLPSLALSQSSVQPNWPVHLDHCFARIILDNKIGVDKPWTSKLKSPAVKNMSAQQLEDCIALGEAIADGKENLVKLDLKSLEMRGKKGKSAPNSSKKRRLEDSSGAQSAATGSEEKSESKKRQLGIKAALSASTKPTTLPPSPPFSPSPASPKEEFATELTSLIQSSGLTPFRQKVLTALCQVPTGRFTTYAALSEFLDSSARAVGNALRNNPFAPRVPCHRVVAADRSLGGFGGEWGKDGKYAGEKVRLLREEGVLVDTGKGRVEGTVWKGFR